MRCMAEKNMHTATVIRAYEILIFLLHRDFLKTYFNF